MRALTPIRSDATQLRDWNKGIVAVAAEIAMQPMWHEDAECRGPSGTLFYPPNRPERRDDRDRRERRAKAICAMCSVKEACLRSALDTNEQHGIWGGLNEAERRLLLVDRSN